MSDDDQRDAPGPFLGSVAVGVTPLPFLAVYALLFVARGTVRPVMPPDIGSSNTDELLAGLVALALFAVGAVAAFWFRDGRRRRLFALFQLLTLAGAVGFLVDPDTEAEAVAILLLLTCVLALGLAHLPPSWAHVGHEPPSWLHRVRRRATPTDSAV